MNQAFESCTGLTNVTIPDSATTIGQGAFSGCTSMRSAIVGNSFTDIGANAFSGCTSLRSVYFVGNAPTSVSYGLFDGDASLIVHYLSESTGWGASFACRSTALWIQQPPYQEWITTTGLADKFPDASGEDPDHDGLSNLQEWQAGTDPTDPNSALKFESTPRPENLVDADKTSIGEGQWAFYFQTVPGKKYKIQSTTAFGGTWQTETNVTVTTTQKRVLVNKPVDQGFYRVVLVP